MRTLLVACAVLVIVAVAAGRAAAQVGDDSVVGTGTDGTLAFRFDARSGPSGEDPSGVAGLSLPSAPSISVGGNVTCLTVMGNHAVVGADNAGGGLPVAGVLFEILDGPTESLSFTLVDTPPTTCPSTLGQEMFPLTSNDITVIDAQPLPITSDQCKNGGWRNYGPAFKNQGDCVSFVASAKKQL